MRRRHRRYVLGVRTFPTAGKDRDLRRYRKTFRPMFGTRKDDMAYALVHVVTLPGYEGSPVGRKFWLMFPLQAMHTKFIYRQWTVELISHEVELQYPDLQVLKVYGFYRGK